MCPDIENFAPLIQATFGGHDLNEEGADASRSLEVRLADRSLRQTNPVMGVLAEVLELASARITATEVLDLAGRDPVRRRFGFSDDDLFRLEEWVNGAFVRWGFDAAHRSTPRAAPNPPSKPPGIGWWPTSPLRKARSSSVGVTAGSGT
jgi:exodeoxyribonuclease V gamma subunit